MSRTLSLRTALAGVVAAALVVVGACGAAASGQGGPGSGRSGAAAQARGTVVGRFVREGGPIGPGGKQPATVPLSGQVTFVSAAKHGVRVHVGRSGRFTVRLAPGTYRVTGKSPEIAGPGDRDYPCAVPQLVRVRSHKITRITVACIVP